MNTDLKIIKKQYGEAMMHLCRCLFATILDNTPGVLPTILQDSFEPNHFLYDDLVSCKAITRFKEYIYTIYDKLLASENTEKNKNHVEAPTTLMRQAGYTLYECTTEEEIQKFKKYYAKGEELCTFKGGRLEHCFVYFAIHENADKLKRRDFSNPRRQDEYGVSVISIQFTRDPSHTLSIKNRYNHTVSNPDATFSNDLDNIIPGLTQSFADYYRMEQGNSVLKSFELPNYVRANDGKLYKYNYEYDNIYYCPGNIMINNFHPVKYPKEKYLIMDYFILDLVNKRVINYSSCKSFPESIGVIKNISIINNHDEKIITITPEVGKDIIIELDKFNRIISYKNSNVLKIGDDFLADNSVLKSISLDNVKEIGLNFLSANVGLTKIELPNVQIIGKQFLRNNQNIMTLDFPSVLHIGDYFMLFSHVNKVNLPKVLTIGESFMALNTHLEQIELPKVLEIKANFLARSWTINKISLPNVLELGPNFLEENRKLEIISLPKVMTIGARFCYHNKIMHEVLLPEVKIIGSNFLTCNQELTSLELPYVVGIGKFFMQENEKLERLICPRLKTIGVGALVNNYKLQEVYAPHLKGFIQNSKLRKLVKESKPKIYQRLLAINKHKSR